MNLIFEYPFGGGGNQGFGYVFNGIYNSFKTHYPDVNTLNIDIIDPNNPHCEHPGGRCGVSTMKIINTANNKTTVLSFWDRTIDIFYAKGLGWEDFNIVHVIGGLGVPESSELIMTSTGIKFTPFLYPLEFLSSYNYIQQFRKPYNVHEKIKKACFIGWVYESRKYIADILETHPLFDIYDTNAGLRGENYYEKMNQYALTLSFNGNGELCLRDVESMGLGIPIIRSEMITPFYKGILPGVNYIRGSEPSTNAFMVYPGYTFKQIAQQFISTVENAINDEALLNSISKNNIEYYDKYLLPDKIVDEFFNVFDLEILK